MFSANEAQKCVTVGFAVEETSQRKTRNTSSNRSGEEQSILGVCAEVLIQSDTISSLDENDNV